jgi:hypothetical protein
MVSRQVWCAYIVVAAGLAGQLKDQAGKPKGAGCCCVQQTCQHPTMAYDAGLSTYELL